MNFKKIVLAVATTLAAGQAFAAVPTGPVTASDINDAKTASTPYLQETWLSGASAPTANMYAAFKAGCDAGTMAIYTSRTKNALPGDLGDYSAYACVRGGNTVHVLYHTVAGGSFNAYTPHITGSAPDGSALPTKLLRVKYIPSNTCGNNGTNAAGDKIYWNCQTTQPGVSVADTAPVIPDIGVSDVEAALWGYDVAAAGEEKNLGITQGFGIAVTTNLYRALQAAQGISIAADAAYNPANAPNITSAQYAAIVKDGGNYQSSWELLMGSSYSNKNVHLQRRVASSGTQASSNTFFLGVNCLNGANGGSVNPAGVNRKTATFRVVEQSSSSTLKTDLENLNQVTAAGSTAAGSVATERTVSGVAQNFGIGVLSLENIPAASSPKWLFVKLDGVHPEADQEAAGLGKARSGIMNGDYKFAMEMKSFIPAASSGTPAEALWDEMVESILAPADCTTVSRGLALTADSGSTCGVGVSKAKGTKIGNNCSKVELWY